MSNIGYIVRAFNPHQPRPVCGWTPFFPAPSVRRVWVGKKANSWSGYVVPGFDTNRRAQLPRAAIRHVLNDERFQQLVIGMRKRSDLEANFETYSGDVTSTREDRALLAEFGAEVMKSDAIKKMKLE